MPLPFKLRDDYPYLTPAVTAILEDLDTETKLAVGSLLYMIWEHDMPEETDHARKILEGRSRRERGEEAAERCERIADEEYKKIKKAKNNETYYAPHLKTILGEEKSRVLIEELIKLHKQSGRER